MVKTSSQGASYFRGFVFVILLSVSVDGPQEHEPVPYVSVTFIGNVVIFVLLYRVIPTLSQLTCQTFGAPFLYSFVFIKSEFVKIQSIDS